MVIAGIPFTMPAIWIGLIVIFLIIEGLTNKEIGRALGLSPRTVETHRANLFAKLQVDSLAHLIRHYASLVDSTET